MDEKNEEMKKALQALADDTNLRRLDELLKEFNIFEALGVVRQELRHSDFLRYLLDPNEGHRLKDTFAKRLLRELGLSDLANQDLSQSQVQREWADIDILLTDEQNRLVIIVENKIDTVEHSEQLQKYLRTIRSHPRYKDWRIVALYLTPLRAAPSDSGYLAVGYAQICVVLESIAKNASQDMQVAIRHYTQAVRRHIVGDSEEIRLSRDIYRKHKRALDFIYTYRPDHRAELYELLVRLITQPNLSLELDDSEQNNIRFTVKEWDPLLKKGVDWTSTGRMLLFAVANNVESVTLG